MGIGGKLSLTLLAAGWLATALATKNGDIERGNAAYEAGDYEAALSSYDAAEEWLGERAELHYNRGLVQLAQENKEEARKAFEHGTEADDPQVRASAEYEIGNIDFDAEAWDAAIQRYTNCLKANPEHRAAKWNLELALLRKKQQEEEQEEQENQDQENQDQENQDQENQDQEKNDEQQDEQQQDEQQQDEEKQDEEKQDEEKQDEEKQDEEQQDQQDQQDQQQDQQDQQQDEQQPQPQPMDKADMDKALEQLDEQDRFLLGRPPAVMIPVEKDW